MFMHYLKRTVGFLAVSSVSCGVVLTLAWVSAPHHDLSAVTRPAQARTPEQASTVVSAPASTILGTTDTIQTTVPSTRPPLVSSSEVPAPSTPPLVASLYGVPLRGDNTAAAPLRLRVIGDSLTVGAKSFWNAVAPPVATVVSVDARSGRPTREGVRILHDAPLEAGETLVVALGTNDSNRYESFKALIDEVMAEAGPSNQVVWPTVWRRGPLSEVNRALWDSMKRYQNLHVLEWTAELVAHPEYREHDNVHYFRAGYEAMVRFIVLHTPRS